MSARFPLLGEMADWMLAREAIRKLKDSSAEPPYSTDPIFQDYRFCNVHREDDRVTRWLAKHWRKPHEWDPMLWQTMLRARMFNWPPSLAHIKYPGEWNSERLYRKLKVYRDKGNKLFTGAYIVSTNGQKMDKLEYVMEVLNTARAEGCIIEPGMTLQKAHARLMRINAVGSFMAGQVIADLKQTPSLADADDWWDWCAPGPGSLRGLNRITNYELKTRWKPDEFVEELIALREQLYNYKRMKEFTPVCLQDLQNCLCETDKYLRLQEGGKVRAGYHSHAQYYKI